MNRILEIDGLSVVLGRREVLSNIDLVVKPGERAALIGPNGSGKSTLLATVAGLRPPAAGSVRVCGVSLDSHKREARQRLGYMVARKRCRACSRRASVSSCSPAAAVCRRCPRRPGSRPKTWV